MNTSTSSSSELPFTDTDVLDIVNALQTGATIGDVCNMSESTLEGLYALGYNLYTAGSYTDADVLFQALCLYKHNEPRFWLGLAGCRQANGNYRGAIDAYSMAGATQGLDDPEPFLFAANCYLKIGDKENAINALRSLLIMGRASNNAHRACWVKAEELLTLLGHHA